jgi:hypothetical protein
MPEDGAIAPKHVAGFIKIILLYGTRCGEIGLGTALQAAR